jgi:hypothetical protein
MARTPEQQAKDFISDTLINNLRDDIFHITSGHQHSGATDEGYLLVQSGLYAAIGTGYSIGRLYWATDTQRLYRGNGSAWVEVNVRQQSLFTIITKIIDTPALTDAYVDSNALLLESNFTADLSLLGPSLKLQLLSKGDGSDAVLARLYEVVGTTEIVVANGTSSITIHTADSAAFIPIVGEKLYRVETRRLGSGGSFYAARLRIA